MDQMEKELRVFSVRISSWRFMVGQASGLGLSLYWTDPPALTYSCLAGCASWWLTKHILWLLWVPLPSLVIQAMKLCPKVLYRFVCRIVQFLKARELFTFWILRPFWALIHILSILYSPVCALVGIDYNSECWGIAVTTLKVVMSRWMILWSLEQDLVSKCGMFLEVRHLAIFWGGSCLFC